MTRLTDEAIGLFDRLVGGLFRRAERRAERDVQANAHAVNDTVRLLARVGGALAEARNAHGDAFAALDAVISWPDFLAAVIGAVLAVLALVCAYPALTLGLWSLF